MSCPHGHARRCDACRMQDLVDDYGTVDEADVERQREADDE